MPVLHKPMLRTTNQRMESTAGSADHRYILSFRNIANHSKSFVCCVYSPFLHQLTVQSSLFEPGRLQPCPSYSRRRDRIHLGLWRSLYNGGGGSVDSFNFAVHNSVRLSEGVFVESSWM